MMAFMVSVFLFVFSVGQSQTDQRDPKRDFQFAFLVKEGELFFDCEKRTHQAFARFTDGSISIKAPNVKELLDQSKTKDATLAAKVAKDYQECEQRIRDAFARFTAGSNSIKADELKQLLDRLYKANNVRIADEAMDNIIRRVDTDKSGDISFYEFAISDKYKNKQ